jgi:serine/threonine-protein kinase
MGEVHRAWDPQLQREVALKVIPRASSQPQGMARFLAEARALARVTAPQVVMVYDLEVAHDPPFLVMELIEGPSLHRLRATGQRFSANQIADCAGQVLRGLAAAHAAGVLHRDLKPGNILRTGMGVYKLVDFGLAMLAAGNERLTGDMEVVGTLRYLAPEVADGAEHSVRSDLFGLGATLVELAAGRPVHGEAQGAALLTRVAQGVGPIA